jgi:hypothetical protein
MAMAIDALLILMVILSAQPSTTAEVVVDFGQ